MGKLGKFIVIIQLCICSLYANAYCWEFEKIENKCDYQFIYIVDTIIIESPVIIAYKNWYYVMSEDLLKNHKVNNKLFQRTDVYILSESGFVSPNAEKFACYPNDYYTQLAFEYDRKNVIKVEEYKNCHYNVYKFVCPNIKFFLTLMNLSMLNCEYCNIMDGPKGRPIKQKNPLNIYYKVVYPFCE